MERIEITIDDEFSLDDLLKSPIPNFMDDNQLFGDAFIQNTEVSSSSSNVAPNQAYCPSLDTTKEEQRTNVGDLKGLYQGGMDLSTCYGAQGQKLFSDGILPMPTPASNLMPTMMRIPVLKTNFQNNTMRLSNMHDTFRPYGHKPTNLQVLQNMHLQQQQLNNNSSHVMCCGATTLVPDISTPQTSTPKSGRISAHERNLKLESYINKRKRRNFSKKIKYACRKTLADSRPRVKGRFAKNDKTEQMARSCSTNSNELQQMERASTSNQAAINYEDLFGSFDFLDESNYNHNLEELGLI